MYWKTKKKIDINNLWMFGCRGYKRKWKKNVKGENLSIFYKAVEEYKK